MTSLRLILFSGFMTALVGAAMGFGLSKIERSPSMIIYRSPYRVQAMYSRHMALAGAGVGFIFGISLQGMKVLKEQRDRELENQKVTPVKSTDLAGLNGSESGH